MQDRRDFWRIELAALCQRLPLAPFSRIGFEIARDRCARVAADTVRRLAARAGSAKSCPSRAEHPPREVREELRRERQIADVDALVRAVDQRRRLGQ
jgi:hypothetical protein